MKRERTSRVLGVVIALIMLLAVTAAPTMAAVASATAAPEKSCGELIRNEDNDKIVKTILGSDKIKDGAKKLLCDLAISGCDSVYSNF